MTRTSTSFAALPEYTVIDVAGYRWMVMRRGDRTAELSPSGEPQLADVSIVETPGADGALTYGATVGAPAIPALKARQEGFTSAEEAIAWAQAFKFASRQVGSLTWLASTPDDRQWYAVIGGSIGLIYWGDPQFGGNFTVSRHVQLGRQWVEFKISDLGFRDGGKSIVSFEQASAIALTMPDYVMELMRVPADATQPPAPGTAG